MPELRGLAFHQSGEQAWLGREFFVAALLDHLAFIDYVNTVGPADCTEAVRHQNARCPETIQAPGDNLLSAVIERAGGFIKDMARDSRWDNEGIEASQ